jgi:hypothetical protein
VSIHTGTAGFSTCQCYRYQKRMALVTIKPTAGNPTPFHVAALVDRPNRDSAGSRHADHSSRPEAAQLTAIRPLKRERMYPKEQIGLARRFMPAETYCQPKPISGLGCFDRRNCPLPNLHLNPSLKEICGQLGACVSSQSVTRPKSASLALFASQSRQHFNGVSSTSSTRHDLRPHLCGSKKGKES